MKGKIWWIFESVPVLFFGYCVLVAVVDPDFFETYVVGKDSRFGAGQVEHLTVVVLLSGSGFGLISLFRYRDRIQSALLRVGLLLWVGACVFFAGEEISWGQWFFQWETPEAMKEINRQGETNLHNTSSWLNEKPRTLVEIWFVFSGLVVAVMRLKGRMKFPVSDWREWVNPYSLGISAVLVFLFSKAIGSNDIEVFYGLGNSEIRELMIAWFLAIYLVSVYLRLTEEDRNPGRETVSQKRDRAKSSETTGLRPPDTG